jgi:hypothetical protein
MHRQGHRTICVAVAAAAVSLLAISPAVAQSGSTLPAPGVSQPPSTSGNPTTPGLGNGTQSGKSNTPGMSQGTESGVNSTPGMSQGTESGINSTPGMSQGTGSAVDSTPGLRRPTTRTRRP